MSEQLERESGSKRPLWIGITTKHGRSEWVERNTHNYVHRVEEIGAIPVILAPDASVQLPDGTNYDVDASGRLPAAILDRLDALILSGGGDVHPERFGQPLAGAEQESIDLRRDELEIHLAQAALARDLPIFAICRGCQVLNVAAGGAMVQHLDGHRTPTNGPTSFHNIAIEPGSRLESIVQQGELPVNTFHHQGMDAASLAPIFTTAAVAEPDNWLVEAYESREHDWVLGVQWHPERAFELEHGHRRIWESFFDAATRTRVR
ncbi:MAG: gamma-glutamyl-gamma-aminobutyrate hydrolase family protein [Anaerolineales bacterium]|nr:gamma-glutamyl-gamma-aminobutyrate hydrolase family protein [Anaerolineales bacterium]